MQCCNVPTARQSACWEISRVTGRWRLNDLKEILQSCGRQKTYPTSSSLYPQLFFLCLPLVYPLLSVCVCVCALTYHLCFLIVLFPPPLHVHHLSATQEQHKLKPTSTEPRILFQNKSHYKQADEKMGASMKAKGKHAAAPITDTDFTDSWNFTPPDASPCSRQVFPHRPGILTAAHMWLNPFRGCH